MIKPKDLIEQLEVAKDEDLPFANISLINNLSEQQKSNLLRKSFKSIYVDADDYEYDLYNEVTFHLKDGTLLQNEVKQEYVTKTHQSEEFSKGETIQEAIFRNAISGFIDSIIIYTQSFKEKQGKIIHDLKSITIVNMAA